MLVRYETYKLVWIEPNVSNVWKRYVTLQLGRYEANPRMVRGCCSYEPSKLAEASPRILVWNEPNPSNVEPNVNQRLESNV